MPSGPLQLRRDANGTARRRGDASLRLTLPQSENARVQLFSGSLAPMSGWVSRSFDTRAPAPTIAWRARLTGPSVLRTEILVRLKSR